MPETAPTQPNDPKSPRKPWKYSLQLPNDPRGATISRRLVRLLLTCHGHIRLVDAAELITAEIVANALLHTDGLVVLRVYWSAGVLRIGAWDTDPHPPEFPTRRTNPAREAGRGLEIVKACADGWGWQPMLRHGHRGKYVWCELKAA